jgi:hypothetical protein
VTKFAAAALLLLLLFFSHVAFSFTPAEINGLEPDVRDKPVGNRIAFWAEQFIGTPYDQDPLGDYVTRAVIVADERVDCMYLTFRAVELALSNSYEEALDKALFTRFQTQGILKDGKVVNYDDRYQDGIEMIRSGKYGTEITASLGETRQFAAQASGAAFDFLPRSELEKGLQRLETGDIIYFVRDPAKASGGLIAHMGIVKVETKGEGTLRTVYLIHASGTKRRGGSVKKVLLADYLSHMQHAGAKITRLSDGK